MRLQELPVRRDDDLGTELSDTMTAQNSDDWEAMLIQAIKELTDEVKAQGELNRINNTLLARRLKGNETPAE